MKDSPAGWRSPLLGAPAGADGVLVLPFGPAHRRSLGDALPGSSPERVAAGQGLALASRRSRRAAPLRGGRLAGQPRVSAALEEGFAWLQPGAFWAFGGEFSPDGGGTTGGG